MTRIKNFKQFNESSGVIELTDNKLTLKSLTNVWPNNIFYNGNPIVKVYSDICEVALNSLDPNSSGSGQEVYFGYEPDFDLFISGWDTWVDTDSHMCEFIGTIAIIKFNNNKAIVKEIEGVVGELIYPTVYKHIRLKYRKLIDLNKD